MRNEPCRNRHGAKREQRGDEKNLFQSDHVRKQPEKRREQAECQIVEAPAVAGRQLVTGERLAAGRATGDRPIGPDEEIRLTYRELTALIEDAVRHLT